MPNINPIVLKTVSGGGGINYTVDVFTSSGTYTKPANLDYAIVLMVGGGGGGGSGRRGAANTNRGGGSGGNGQSVLLKIPASVLESTETVTVGAGSSGAAAQTTDNTNGINPTTAGFSLFVNRSPNLYFLMRGGGGFGGGTSILFSQNASNSGNTIIGFSYVLSTPDPRLAIALATPTDQFRGNSFTFGGSFSIFNSTSMGAPIRNTNVQETCGGLPGFYNDSNVLTGEMPGTAPESNGVQPTEFYTFGQYLAKLLPWFDPADANYNIGRGGLGGGCGDTAGTVAGGNGADALGYGAGGGGGGASTNGANSGAGGNGSQGIVIIINVLTS